MMMEGNSCGRREDAERAWSGESSAEEGSDEEREWSDVREELLSMVLSRLAMGEYYAFQSVCKSWNFVTPIHRPLSSSPHDDDSYQTSHLMYLNAETDRFNFHDPSRNANYSLNIPQLLDDDDMGGEVEFHYASCGWLLLGRGGSLISSSIPQPEFKSTFQTRHQHLNGCVFPVHRLPTTVQLWAYLVIIQII